MITEDYVSFEIAKLLKEKGFNEITNYHYNEDDRRLYGDGDIELTNSDLEYNSYNGFSAPSLYIVMKWLREKHNIIISIYPFGRDATSLEVNSYTCDIATPTLTSLQGHLRGTWKTYERACEAAIKNCLETII